jgi:hypothetical protein
MALRGRELSRRRLTHVRKTKFGPGTKLGLARLALKYGGPRHARARGLQPAAGATHARARYAANSAA